MGTDRRVRRTRAALTAAFTDLALERGYQAIAINDVTERADVGRSTLYTHFSGMDDLLAQSLDRHLRTISKCSLESELQPELVRVVEHFWQQRKIARVMLSGEPAAAITRLLVSHLDTALHEFGTIRRLPATFPVALLSVQMASGQLALLRAWLAGKVAAPPEDVARLLQATSNAAANAAFFRASTAGRSAGN